MLLQTRHNSQEGKDALKSTKGQKNCVDLFLAFYLRLREITERRENQQPKHKLDMNSSDASRIRTCALQEEQIDPRFAILICRRNHLPIIIKTHYTLFLRFYPTYRLFSFAILLYNSPSRCKRKFESIGQDLQDHHLRHCRNGRLPYCWSSVGPSV